MNLPGDKEIHFLLLVLKQVMGLTAAPRPVGDDLNWDRLVRLASEHGVSLLLYSHLSKQSSIPVPQVINMVLKNQLLQNLRRNIGRTTQLVRALALLHSHGIRALPFKGPVLAELAHGDLALRPFSDVDVLVKGNDFLRATSLLQKNGWKSNAVLSARTGRLWVRSRRDLEFVRAGWVMDCHQQLTQGPRFLSPGSHIWRGTRPVTLLNRSFRTLSPENTVISICLNGAKDQWATIKPITDLSLFLTRTPGLNWDLLLENASTMGSRNILLLGLDLCEQLLGFTPPAPIRQKIAATPLIGRISRRILDRIFDKQPDQRMFYRFLFIFRLLDNRRFRLSYLAHFLFSPTPRDFALMPLPEILYPLYYLLRPLRVAISTYYMVIRTMIHGSWEKHRQ